METSNSPAVPRAPWNKGKLTGQKPPLKLCEIWAIRALSPVSGRFATSRRSHLPRDDSRRWRIDFRSMAWTVLRTARPKRQACDQRLLDLVGQAADGLFYPQDDVIAGAPYVVAKVMVQADFLDRTGF